MFVAYAHKGQVVTINSRDPAESGKALRRSCFFRCFGASNRRSKTSAMTIKRKTSKSVVIADT